MIYAGKYLLCTTGFCLIHIVLEFFVISKKPPPTPCAETIFEMFEGCFVALLI